jgi:hypothetical protein
MHIFISYPAEESARAERIAVALRAEGHTTFWDRRDLSPGAAFHQRIRAAIQECDVMVYLMTPRSVSEGSYTLTELKLAEAKWPRPQGYVIPVMAQPTPLREVPAYLSAATVLIPRGDLVGETVAAVATHGRPDRSRELFSLLRSMEIVYAGLQLYNFYRLDLWPPTGADWPLTVLWLGPPLVSVYLYIALALPTRRRWLAATTVSCIALFFALAGSNGVFEALAKGPVGGYLTPALDALIWLAACLSQTIALMCCWKLRTHFRCRSLMSFSA